MKKKKKCQIFLDPDMPHLPHLFPTTHSHNISLPLGRAISPSSLICSIFFSFYKNTNKHTHTHTHTHTCVCASTHTHTHTHKHACAHSSLTLSHRYPTPHHHLYHLFPVKFTAKIHRKMLRLIHIYYLR